MVELSHDGRLPQEVAPLLLGVAGLQGLDGDLDLSLPRQPQRAAANLAKLACAEKPTALNVSEHVQSSSDIINVRYLLAHGSTADPRPHRL